MLLTREQLQERLFALHRASLELVKDVSLETLLNVAIEHRLMHVETLAYMLNMAFHSGLARVARDSSFSLLDFVRADIWLWLAVRVAMTGRVDVNAELSRYEDRIRDLVASEPAVFPGPAATT